MSSSPQPRPDHASERRWSRVLPGVLGLVLLVAGVLVASPASAAITAPAAGETVSGSVVISENRGSTNTCIGRDDSSSRIEVLSATGARVHEATRGSSGGWSTTWSSVGRANGEYRIRTFARDSVRSGFANLGCTTRAETLVDQRVVTLDNRAAVTVTAPGTVVTGEDLRVQVSTRVDASGVSGVVAADRDVVVTVPGVGERTVRTNAAGNGSVVVDLPDLPVGPLDIDARVVSDAFLRGLSSATSTRLLHRSTTTVYEGDTRAQPGASAELSARLVDSTPGSDRVGEPVADQDVSLRFEDSVATATTAQDGVARRDVIVRGGSRTAPVTATFTGNDVHGPSADEIVFFVGDAAAEPAVNDHDLVGGVVRGLNGLLGSLLAPVTGLLDEAATQQPVQSLLLDPLDRLSELLGVPPRTGSVWDLADVTALLDLTLATVTDGLVALADDTDSQVEQVLQDVTLGPDLDALLDVTRFRWRAVLDQDGLPRAREFRATIGVPQPLDVTGDGHPDVLANLTLASDFLSLQTAGVDGALRLELDAGADPRSIVPRLEVARLPGAPEDLPLSLQALVQLPGSADEFRFGYDARDGSAPEGFLADLVLGEDEVGVELATRSDAALTVSGAIVPEGASGESATPAPREQRFAIGFDTAPPAARLGLRLDGSSDVAADLQTSVPTAVDVSFVDDSGAERVTTADVALDRVDGRASVAVSGDGADGAGVGATIESASGMDSVVVDGQQLESGRIDTEVRLALTDVPDSVRFGLGADGAGTLEASAPIGVFEAGFATAGRILDLDDEAYLRLLQAGERTSLAVRLPEFERMGLGLGDDLGIDLTKKAGPLAIRADLEDLAVDGRVEDAPRTVALAIESSGGVTIEGSDVIESVDLTASTSDPEGIFQGASQVDVRLRDLPRRLEVAVGDDGVTFGTDDEPIGLLELEAHSGTPLAIPGGGDGLVLDLTGESSSVAARISGLRAIEADLGDAPELLLDTVARQVFSVVLRGETRADDITATLDRLVPETRLALVDGVGGETSLTYRASESTERLSFGLSGLTGSIGGPLPDALDICIADDEACLPGAGIANPSLGSMSLEGSEYTTLNLSDDSGELSAENLRLRRMDLTGSISDDGGPLYLNTTSFDGECGFAGCEYPLRGGRIVSDLGNAELTFTPGDGFSAVDAVTVLETTSVLGVPTGLRGRSGTGIVRCVPATALRVRVEIIGIPLTLNLRDAICNVSRPPRTP